MSHSTRRWQLLYNLSFSPEWEALVAGRDPRTTYLWLPDDDVVASACNVSRFLGLMEEQQLLLAQVGRGWGRGGTGGGDRRRRRLQPWGR